MPDKVAFQHFSESIYLKLTLLLMFGVFFSDQAFAESAVFRKLRTVSVSELNAMLDSERAKFISGETPGQGYVLPSASTAHNAVDIYSVSYNSEIPELGGKKIVATGMVALPVLQGKKRIPLISYQHGTVYGKYEVPSFAFVTSNPTRYSHYDGAYETRYMVGLFAGNGYALIAADYFGMGGSADYPESYFVKASSQQANYDLYKEVQAFLKAKGISQENLFLGGWSQGGLYTTGFLEKLEAEGIKVQGAFTASNPADPFAALNGLMYHPRPGIDGPWANTIVALSTFAYENYYNQKDLGGMVISPNYYAALKSIYDRSYRDPKILIKFLTDNAGVPLLSYFRPEYSDPSYFANSTYGKLLAAAETYRQEFKASTITFYGTNDEVIMEKIGQLANLYQGVLIGDTTKQGQNAVQVQQVVGGTHRLTFITAAPAAKAWMDSLRSPQ